MLIPRARRLATLIGVSIVFAGLCLGCTVEQELFVRSDGTGSGKATVTIDPAVSRYIDAIFQAVGGAAGDQADPLPLFDTERIAEELRATPGIEPVSVEIVDRNTLSVSYKITDFSAALDGALTFEASAGSTRKLSLSLDRSSFTRVSRLFIDEESPAAAFIPVRQSDFLNADDYRELAHYALEEFATDRSVDQILDGSTVSIAVRTDGTIRAVSGGELAGAKALYTLRLLDLVTLEDPIHLTLSWR